MLGGKQVFLSEIRLWTTTRTLEEI